MINPDILWDRYKDQKMRKNWHNNGTHDKKLKG